MKSLRRNFLLLLFLFSSTGYGQGRSSADKAGFFDGYVRQALTLWRTPGISIVIVKDDKVVFRKGFGVTELGKDAPFTTSTLGLCASTTKAMTAACIGMLVDEGRLQWTDKVRDLLPEFSLYDPYASAELTVRDLLTHNAGLGNTDNLWIYGYSGEEILRRLKLVPPAYSLRSSFIYQNCMYIVAGELIRRVSGQRWEDFITRRLFGPLGMHHTYANYGASTGEPSHETPHCIDGDNSIRPISYMIYDNVDPAGGAWTCADDMDKWMRFMLDSAVVDGKRLLKPGTWAELFRPQTLVTEREFYPTLRLTHSSRITYGLGWFQEDYRGRLVQFHTGSLDGAVAIIGLLPSEHFGIYILGNLGHSEIRHALMYKAMDLWGFSDKGRDWSAECFAMYRELKEAGQQRDRQKEAQRVKGTKTSLPMYAYAGNYTNEIYGNARVVLAGDSLRVELPNDVRLSLQHWNYDTFVGYYNYFWWDREWLQFSLDTEGKITRFEKDGVVYIPVKN
jgi:CubicO group peptidase (beta-lactamase class C family)